MICVYDESLLIGLFVCNGYNYTSISIINYVYYLNSLSFSYQRADPNFVMLTPNKEHLAEGIVWKIGSRPMLESDVNAGNFDRLPKELRPQGRML